MEKQYTLLEKFYNGRYYLLSMIFLNAGILLSKEFELGVIFFNIITFMMFLKIENFRTVKQ